MKRNFIANLCIATVMSFSLFAMEEPSKTHQVAHLFIIDLEKRMIALFDEGSHFALPSIQVPEDKFSDQAILDLVLTKGKLPISDQHFIGRIECLPQQSFFSMVDFLSLFGIKKAQETDNQARSSHVSHFYYLAFVSQQDCGLRWLELQELYQSQAQNCGKKVIPAETFDILRLMSAARQGKAIDVAQAAPVLEEHFKSQHINANINIFIPTRLMDYYIQNIRQAKKDTSKAAMNKGSKNGDNLMLLFALPFLMSVASDSDHCVLF